MDIEELAAQYNIKQEDIPGSLFEMAFDQYQSYELSGDLITISKAVYLAKEGIHRVNSKDQAFARLLNNLGICLHCRYERTGEAQDLEEAIEAARQAVDSTPHNHPDRASYLNNFGNELESRYERMGEMDDLEQAIKAARQAVDSTPHDHPNQAGWLNNLGSKLERRYKRMGEMDDLEQAIKAAKQAVDSTPHDHPNWAGYLNMLGNMLGSRYERIGEIDDLEQAIKAARQAVDSTPHDHPNRTGWLNNLGGKLERRYKRMGEMDDLEQAIKAAKQAVDSTPHDHPNWAGYLNMLGNMLESRYKRIGEIDDLEQAIKAARQAVNSTPHNHPDRAGKLYNLGNKLESRYKRTGEMGDLNKASISLQEAARSSSAVPFDRIRAAVRGLKLLALQEKVDDGIKLGTLALDLIPIVHTRLLDRSDQQFVLSTFAGVASDLCAFLLSAGRSHDALQCLEQGRAVMISQLLDDRNDLSALTCDCPALAKKYQSLVGEVNSSSLWKDEDSVAQLYLVQRRREAAVELKECINEIRAVYGYERFLLGQTVTEMQECALDGHIVVVNATELRSDAIIMSRHSLETIPLPDLESTEAKRWLRKSWFTKKRSEQQAINNEFLQYLSWLWNNCVKHILARIPRGQTQLISDPSRIWWIGCGLASSMPFHAAGLHTECSTENAYSKVVSSYTPSIKALFYARQQARRAEQEHTAQDQMLIATMLTTPKHLSDAVDLTALPGVLKEKDEILKTAASGIRTTFLSQPSAEQVLHVLPHCRIAHFACHGTSDQSDPSNSGLILQRTRSDGSLEQDFLSVSRLSQSHVKCAQIAYLSACSTAENKAARLSDEVLHIVSGFQVAGFPHVVGCLWPAGDSECVKVAKGFYTSIFSNGQSTLCAREVASALQKAVMEVRAADISMPLNWAQFVHFGA